MNSRTKLARAIVLIISILAESSQARDLKQASLKAFQYLEKESLQWVQENKCYSCHNNGDAARALFLTSPKLAARFSGPQWRELIEWYQEPDKWNEASNRELDLSPTLGLVQFAATSIEAQRQTLRPMPPSGYARIRSLILAAQHEDGSWHLENEGQLGSPATYGNVLGTLRALEILAKLPTAQSKTATDRAINWIDQQNPHASIELAAGSQILKLSTRPKEQAKSRLWLRRLRDQQNRNGGWGPFRSQFSEIFDTAIALIALCSQPKPDIEAGVILAGRSFLIENQESDGGWLETTRPSGGTSYAQHISTTAWALIALNKTEAISPRTIDSQKKPLE